MTRSWIRRWLNPGPSWWRRGRAVALGAALMALAGCAAPTVSDSGAPAQPAPPPAPVAAPAEPSVAPPAPVAVETAPPAEVRVGLLLPLSGDNAPLGQALLRAAQMALFEAAPDDFALIVRDTGGSDEVAERAARDAIAAGAQLLLGPVFAGSVRAVTPAARAAGINVIAFSTDRKVAGDGVFVMGLLPSVQVERIVGYAYAQGLRRFAALAPDTPYGRTVVEALQGAASRAGGAVVAVEYYDPAAADVAPAVRRLARYEARSATLTAQREALAGGQDQASQEALTRLGQYAAVGELGFDAVLLAEGGDRLRAVAPLLPYYDIDPAAVRFLGTALFAEPGLGTEPALVGAWFAAPAQAAWDAFAARYRAAYGAAPPRLAGLAYDATALAAALASRFGGADFGVDALIRPSGFAGVDGIFRFRPDGTVERGLAVFELQRGGLLALDPAPDIFGELLY